MNNYHGKLTVYTDGGILSIVDTASYNRTLNFQNIWTWSELNKFILEINQGNLIAFQTSWEDEWTFGILINKTSDRAYVKKFEQNIIVTSQMLHLVNWTDLTSSLQFENAELPDEGNKDLNIKLPNGNYLVVVKQLFSDDNEDYDPTEHDVNYIIELIHQDNTTYKLHPSTRINWSIDFPNDDTLFLDNNPNELDDFIMNLINKDKNSQ